MKCTPTYPVTEHYDKDSLIKHNPWSRNDMMYFTGKKDEILNHFDNFLGSPKCPQILKMEVKRLCTSHGRKKRFCKSKHLSINTK